MVVGGRFIRRIALAVVAVLFVTWLTAGLAYGAQVLGTLTQLSATAGCFTYNGASEDGAGTCSQARGLAEGESATVSPDGANVYVGSYPNSGASLGAGFAVFSRNSSSGALTQLSGTAGCLTPDGSSSAGPGTCTKARGLIANPGDGLDLAFTSDGRWAYMAVSNQPPTSQTAILIFQRDPTSGALTQLPGTGGCISTDGSSQDGAGTCQTDATLNEASGISISSDDRFVYVTGTGIVTSHRFHVFARNMSTGALTDIECISESPAPVGCSTGRVLGNTQAIALSPDGMHAYGGEYQRGISVFDRDPTTGLLTQKAGTAGCITNDGLDDTGASTCAVGRVTRGTFPLLVAPNGQTLYNMDGHIGFSMFHINADGTLTQLSGTDGCVTIDGKDNTGASTCATGRAINSPYGGVISPDGGTLYVSNDDSATAGGLGIFSLNPATGVATQLGGLQGCITGDGSSGGTPGQCTNGRALGFGYGMAISADGNSVYQATDASSNAGLAIYRRETAPTCQSTSAMTAARRPVTLSLRCTDGDGDAITRAIASGPSHGHLSAIDNSAGTVTYTPSSGFTGTDHFTFNASDGVNASPAATATVTVVRPVLSSLRVSPSRFSLAGRKVRGRCVKPTKRNAHNPRCRRPIRLRVSFKLNIATNVAFTVARRVVGRKVNGRCVTRTPKNRTHRSCKRFVKLHGKIAINGTLGANHFIFRGKIGRQTLGPGTYRLIATPTGGLPSKATFKIVP